MPVNAIEDARKVLDKRLRRIGGALHLDNSQDARNLVIDAVFEALPRDGARAIADEKSMVP